MKKRFHRMLALCCATVALLATGCDKNGEDAKSPADKTEAAKKKDGKQEKAEVSPADKMKKLLTPPKRVVLAPKIVCMTDAGMVACQQMDEIYDEDAKCKVPIAEDRTSMSCAMDQVVANLKIEGENATMETLSNGQALITVKGAGPFTLTSGNKMWPVSVVVKKTDG